MDYNFKEATDKLEDNVKFILSKLDMEIQAQIQEIRMRLNSPLMIKIYSNNYYVYQDGKFGIDNKFNKFIIDNDKLNKSFQKICQYSIYAYQDQINNGFITLKGGHRVGICGSAILKDESIVNLKNISSLNIRISRNILDVSDDFINKTMKDGLTSVLIAGRPGSGKTTLLKDIIRKISSGKLKKIYNISVIDERGEISGGYNSDQLNKNMFFSADIFDGYLKAQGMMIAIRTMAPDLIVCDEIGTNEELKAIESAFNSGVKIIATIHAGNKKEIYFKPQIKKIIELKAFDKIVILDSDENPCVIKDIISLK